MGWIEIGQLCCWVLCLLICFDLIKSKINHDFDWVLAGGVVGV